MHSHQSSGVLFLRRGQYNDRRKSSTITASRTLHSHVEKKAPHTRRSWREPGISTALGRSLNIGNDLICERVNEKRWNVANQHLQLVICVDSKVSPQSC